MGRGHGAQHDVGAGERAADVAGHFTALDLYGNGILRASTDVTEPVAPPKKKNVLPGDRGLVLLGSCWLSAGVGARGRAGSTHQAARRAAPPHR